MRNSRIIVWRGCQGSWYPFKTYHGYTKKEVSEIYDPSCFWISTWSELTKSEKEEVKETERSDF